MLVFVLVYITLRVSSFATSSRGRESWLLSFVGLQMSCYCECSVALPHVVVGWSLVCDCGIS